VLLANGSGSSRFRPRNRYVANHLVEGRLGSRVWAANLRRGYFGASTGAAAALVASVECEVHGIVSRGGRPDLAGATLLRVTAPTLLIVGSQDPVVIELNETALRLLQCEARLEILPGATHPFEEPDTLEQVATLALRWFHRALA
jgi:putative phosphoribosyl transferase